MRPLCAHIPPDTGDVVPCARAGLRILESRHARPPADVNSCAPPRAGCARQLDSTTTGCRTRAGRRRHAAPRRAASATSAVVYPLAARFVFDGDRSREQLRYLFLHGAILGLGVDRERPILLARHAQRVADEGGAPAARRWLRLEASCAVVLDAGVILDHAERAAARQGAEVVVALGGGEERLPRLAVRHHLHRLQGRRLAPLRRRQEGLVAAEHRPGGRLAAARAAGRRPARGGGEEQLPEAEQQRAKLLLGRRRAEAALELLERLRERGGQLRLDVLDEEGHGAAPLHHLLDERQDALRR
eukprot:CAMPEP_0185358606 /NCGR_PEP_ID=MMETSP1364-20130426/8293_1 /TAXON_ID=38817 /ORGANISM="Gephyrocapsa oceanica, Strain RCC1303" /LENGTH=301 /DNA_ID=CAMNT_0027958725 /DNA_START=36 /DNA_END=938 /DNA_ORIENTATION=+